MFKNRLNPLFWNEDNKIKEFIRKRLLLITDNYIKSLEVDFDIKDIILTGSNANFDWNEFSDIDIHLLVDYKNDKTKKKMMDKSRLMWNIQHNIKIKGYKVEIYGEDVNDFHLSSGIYSLTNDKWLKKPSKFTQLTTENIKYINKKSESFKHKINYLFWLLNNNKKPALNIYETSEELFNYLKDRRQKSLEIEGKGGLMNQIYKKLRNEKYLEKLFNLINESYDKIYSIK